MSESAKKSAGTKKPSASYQAALDMLPPEYHGILDRLVEQYKFAALKQHGHAMVSPRVIAELILMGWRESDMPRPADPSERKEKD